MTPEEAKKLKPGDRVLAAVTIQEVLESSVFVSSEYVDFYNIVDKATPPRRKFREGDIVRIADDASFRVHEVCGDEVCGIVKVRYYCRGIVSYKAGELSLICAVEDRADGKEEA